MAGIKGVKRDGRTNDLTFSWLLKTHGEQWQQWQVYAAQWMKIQDTSIGQKRTALTSFFENFLLNHVPYAINVMDFFKGKNGHKCSSEEFIKIMSERISYKQTILRNNRTVDFINWVIDTHFSVEDDNNIRRPIVNNPLDKLSLSGTTISETVRNPLPYRYIQDLRHILCPLPNKTELQQTKAALGKDEPLLPPYCYRHFKDWTWAQIQTGQTNNSSDGDWFEIDPELIDKNDPDCVWRIKEVLRRVKGKGNQKITIHQIWSPVKAMLIFMKLHLPLRTYQIRFLDSGEADTLRYENSKWVENNVHDFALGTPKRPFAKGVFKRIMDSMSGQYSTGLYISTNKTADKNKDEIDRGYTIPWQHEELLYWLEKLRNWQEKYNPIDKPTSCSTLLTKHLGIVKSKKAKTKMGELCFLFRDASAKGDNRAKPIPTGGGIDAFWYNLLLELENNLFTQGVTLKDGSLLNLVKEYPEGVSKAGMRSTLFPLHSLRVSLITAYTMDTELPLPVISKLLAGHTRLLMTIYYNKITPSVMGEKMDEAELQLEDKSEQSIRLFLKDASLEQIQCKMVYRDADSIMAALANRNPIGWEYRSLGVCLVGGNTVRSDETSTLGGCWNGGEVLAQLNGISNVYTPVPHGPENCVRCRWFISDGRFLTQLNAHFNQIGYNANLASNLSIEIEGELEVLKDEQYFAEEQGKPFTKHNELQALQRRYEKQQVETDEFTKDYIATYNLIQRIMHLESNRDEDDNRDKLVAVGSQDDINYSLRFVETDSELLHLSWICEDAEFYPDLQDQLRKTPAINKRTIQLSRMMMKKGYEPIFMEMDDKMQLVAANAMIRSMAKLADPDDKLEGYRKVAGYLEAGDYLKDHKLLDAGINALSDTALVPLKNNGPALLESA